MWILNSSRFSSWTETQRRTHRSIWFRFVSTPDQQLIQTQPVGLILCVVFIWKRKRERAKSKLISLCVKLTYVRPFEIDQSVLIYRAAARSSFAFPLRTEHLFNLNLPKKKKKVSLSIKCIVDFTIIIELYLGCSDKGIPRIVINCLLWLCDYIINIIIFNQSILNWNISVLVNI